MTSDMRGSPAILVPLDGSSRAEQALPVAESIARATRGQLVLARVNPATTWITSLSAEGAMAAPEIYQQIVDDEDRLAREYVDAQADRLRERGGSVRTVVLRGVPAAMLIDLEEAEHVWLVVMTTHGRTGLPRFALGSVADRLVRAGAVPVLLLRSFATRCESPHLERAVVPLDGSARAERALDVCERLAGTMVRHILLVRVVTPDATDADRSAAGEYLADLRARRGHQFARLNCTLDTDLLVGDVAQQIVAHAERHCDLIVLATHGRSGAARWALGSVADRVLEGAATPLLLVRARDESPAGS